MAPSAGSAPSQPPAAGGPADVPVRQVRFARWAAHYEHSQLQQMLYEPVHRRVLELARHSVPDPDLILDIGCGTGRLPRSCVRCFPKAMVIGIDPCAEMIDQADTSPTPAQWLQARAEALPFGDHVFSLVLSTLSLRHWQDSHQGLAEISRITTHNGTVMIADALINDVLSPPLPGAPSKVSGRRGNPWRVPRRAIRPRARGSARVSAGASYALAQAGLGVEHAEEIVLALATVTLIVASNSTARTT